MENELIWNGILILSFLPLCISDLRRRWIPVGFLIPPIAAGIVKGIFDPDERIIMRLGMAIIILVFILLINKVSREGIGEGDAYVMGTMSFCYGLWTAGIMICIGLITSAFISIGLLAVKKGNRKTELPLIPFLYLGILVVSVGILGE